MWGGTNAGVGLNLSKNTLGKISEIISPLTINGLMPILAIFWNRGLDKQDRIV